MQFGACSIQTFGGMSWNILFFILPFRQFGWVDGTLVLVLFYVSGFYVIAAHLLLSYFIVHFIPPLNLHYTILWLLPTFLFYVTEFSIIFPLLFNCQDVQGCYAITFIV